MLYIQHYESIIGDISLVEREGALIGLWIEGQKYFLSSLKEEPIENETALLGKSKEWLDRYFAGERPSIDELKLLPNGSEFRQEVWKILCSIPYGEVVTYGEIAKEIAMLRKKEKMSSRAVGGAVGHNPISIIIPCHRVVGAGGNLTGYAGGIPMKIKLLTHEGVDMSGLYVPKKNTII